MHLLRMGLNHLVCTRTLLFFFSSFLDVSLLLLVFYLLYIKEHEDDLIAELQNVIAKLPPVNKSVLCLLLAYLHESGSDKLGLSIALGPVLLKSRNPSKTNDESKACSLAVMRLIAHQEKLFSGAKEGILACSRSLFPLLLPAPPPVPLPLLLLNYFNRSYREEDVDQEPHYSSQKVRG